jgi:hypothetical protein
MAEQTDAGRFSWGVSGLKLEIERCPDAADSTCMKNAAGLGVGTWGAGWLLGWSPMGRLMGAAVGATVGILAGRYHVYMDWDPDRARGRPEPEAEPMPMPETS